MEDEIYTEKNADLETWYKDIEPVEREIGDILLVSRKFIVTDEICSYQQIVTSPTRVHDVIDCVTGAGIRYNEFHRPGQLDLSLWTINIKYDDHLSFLQN